MKPGAHECKDCKSRLFRAFATKKDDEGRQTLFMICISCGEKQEFFGKMVAKKKEVLTA